MVSRKSLYIFIFEIFYGGQKLHKYLRSLRTKDTALRNGRKFKCKNKPFIVIILILRRVLF